MKKVLKVLGIIVLVIIIVIAAVLFYLSRKGSSLSEDYQSKVATGGDIEAKYLKNGVYETSYYEIAAIQNFSKYEIYYPTELLTSDKEYPVIVVCNGTGWPGSRSKPLYEHYASWGFIVIATEEEYSWNAFGADMCVGLLKKLNDTESIELDGFEDKKNVFYGHIDFNNIGIVGHSQGGVGVVNAITNSDHQDIYRTAAALSPTGKELALGIDWPYDATKINVPILLISGAGGGDDWVVTGEGLADIYNDISANKVMARRKDTDHGKTQFSEDGYVTAWFMWQLQGDAEAAKAFTGSAPEIMNNPLYQDQRIDIGER